MSRAAADASVDFLPWHVPVLVLVAKGIDSLRALRAGSESELDTDANVAAVLDAAVDDEVWRTVAQLAVDAGWRRVTVDAFASES